MSDASLIRERIIGDYYCNAYDKVLFGGLQGIGISYFESLLEKSLTLKKVDKVLELGGGSGQHLPYVNDYPAEEYISLDLKLPKTLDVLEEIPLQLSERVQFAQGNAEKLDFQDGHFDRVIATCLLHHVNDPLAVMLEAKRVTRIGGEICYALPTDPGIFNRLIRNVVTYNRMRKFTKWNPKLLYALDHINKIDGLIEIFKFVYNEDEVSIKYYPLRISSWNLNLAVLMHVRVINKTKLQ